MLDSTDGVVAAAATADADLDPFFERDAGGGNEGDRGERVAGGTGAGGA